MYIHTSQNESPFGLVKLRMNQANIYHISNHCIVHTIHTKVSKKIWHYLTSIFGLSHSVYEWITSWFNQIENESDKHLSYFQSLQCT